MPSFGARICAKQRFRRDIESLCLARDALSPMRVVFCSFACPPVSAGIFFLRRPF
jgi:hypothetical protein